MPIFQISFPWVTEIQMPRLQNQPQYLHWARGPAALSAFGFAKGFVSIAGSMYQILNTFHQSSLRAQQWFGEHRKLCRPGSNRGDIVVYKKHGKLVKMMKNSFEILTKQSVDFWKNYKIQEKIGFMLSY